jgi:hypothetical protein
VRTSLLIALACLVGCLADDVDDDDPVEDLGALGGKADKVMTRNVTLRPHLQSGAPSRRTFTVSTAARFRVSVGYPLDAQTRLVVSDDSGTLAESALTWQPTVVIPAASEARSIKIRVENAAAEEVPVRLHVGTLDGRTLRVATFNIRWYGIGGDLDAPTTETRNLALRTFFADHLADADLVVFQEILDVAMLRAEVVPAGWSCATYASTAANHQFVVACLAPGYSLTREADDDDLAYQPLAMSWLRPGLAGIVRDDATRAPLARLVGVHLKALPDSTDRRLAQARILVDRLATLATKNEQLPTIVIGDFNSHRAVDTHGTRDDWDLIGDVLASHPELGLARVAYSFEHTFRNKAAKAYRLDHLWLGAATASEVEVPGPCNLSWELDRAAIELYYDTISDHCPVIATVTLP